MTELKCPFCGRELKISGHELHDLDLYCDKCEPFMVGNKELWQELIRAKELLDIESSEHELCHDAMVKRTEELDRTRKALDVAVDALKEITNNDYDADWQNDLAQATLEKIKDIK